MSNETNDLPTPPGWVPRAYPPDPKRPTPAYVDTWLGFLYLGQSLEKDEEKALAWFQRGAEKGDVYAQSILGYLYEKGIGTAPDRTAAAFWWEKAASQAEAANLAVEGLNRLNQP